MKLSVSKVESVKAVSVVGFILIERLFNWSPWDWILKDILEINPAVKLWFCNSTAVTRYCALPFLELVFKNSEEVLAPDPIVKLFSESTASTTKLKVFDWWMSNLGCYCKLCFRELNSCNNNMVCLHCYGYTVSCK